MVIENRFSRISENDKCELIRIERRSNYYSDSRHGEMLFISPCSRARRIQLQLWTTHDESWRIQPVRVDYTGSAGLKYIIMKDRVLYLYHKTLPLFNKKLSIHWLSFKDISLADSIFFTSQFQRILSIIMSRHRHSRHSPRRIKRSQPYSV